MNQEDEIRGIQERYRLSGRCLNELQRRLWAASEAIKLGRGGITAVSKALRISPNTIKRGIQEIAAGQAISLSDENRRIRKPGGGRKSKKTPLIRSTRAQQINDSAETSPALKTPESIDENRHDSSPILTQGNSKPINESASDQ